MNAAYKCNKCGGSNVEHAMWIELNTGNVLEPFGEWCYGDNNWCQDCQEHTGIEEVKEQPCPACSLLGVARCKEHA